MKENFAGENVRNQQDPAISVETDCAVKRAIRTDLELINPVVKEPNYQMQMPTIAFEIRIVIIFDTITNFRILYLKELQRRSFNVRINYTIFRLYWRRKLFDRTL